MDANVTMKASPEEFRTIRRALENEAQRLKEVVGTAHKRDMQALRVEQGKVADLLQRL